MLYKRAFFDLEDRGTLNTFKGVPHILGNVNTIAAFFMTEDDAVTDGTIIIIRSDLYLTSQYDKRLVFRRMSMDRYHCPWLYRIQKSMAFILQRLMEVIVHP